MVVWDYQLDFSLFATVQWSPDNPEIQASKRKGRWWFYPNDIISLILILWWWLINPPIRCLINSKLMKASQSWQLTLVVREGQHVVVDAGKRGVPPQQGSLWSDVESRQLSRHVHRYGYNTTQHISPMYYNNNNRLFLRDQFSGHFWEFPANMRAVDHTLKLLRSPHCRAYI